MKKRPPLLSYPLTIRQVDEFLVFAIPDLNISIVKPLHTLGRITPEVIRLVATTAHATWKKAFEHLERVSEVGKRPPDPSIIRAQTQKGRSKPLTIKEVAKRLEVSENTVRRISKRSLRYWKTGGGHRRYSEAAVRLYEEQRDGSGLEK